MKNPLYLCLSLVLFSFLSANSQQKCITSEKMAEILNADPVARSRFETTQHLLENKVKQTLSDPNYRLFKTTEIITIPVVVHIMYGNNAQVTDAIVQRQIDTLNRYYGDAPANDSLRVYPAFRTSYGRSQIRFCLAKRTPDNQPTNGITRTFSTFNPNGSAHPSTVVPAWNTTKYLNIWVVDFGNGGTLGYSYLPGTFAPGDQRAGFVVDYRAFGSNAGYLYSDYNMGKTAVHEIGHYFNLLHTWGNGNSNTSCNGDDQCTDTPKTSGAYGGCTTSGPVTNSCSPTEPGIMWQNHMDYADDRCMLLFTLQQCARMEAALNNAPDRSPLKTSIGCQPAVAPPNDAAISAILQPANGGYVCSASIVPQAVLLNAGSDPLTSVVINVSLNGNPQPPFAWSGMLATNATTTVSLPAVTLVPGLNTITVRTSQPNGAADDNTTNDSRSITTTYTPATTLPVMEGFESTTFPPANWILRNPDNDFTWERFSPGRASQGAMFINNYDDDGTDNIDELRSYNIQTGGTSSLILKFDLAHKFYPSDGYHDTLSVLVSGDCGNTYQTVYKKWGAQLATAGSSLDAYINPQESDWRTENVTINGLASANVIVVFRNTSMFGNNIFIDNINITSPVTRDLQLETITSPSALICTTRIAPQVIVRNQGQEIINSFKVGYQLDNGAVVLQNFNTPVNPQQTITVSLTAFNVNPGNRTIRLFTADPVSAGGMGDINRTNDTLVKAFALPGTAPLPFSESFITAAFPPANWVIINPDNSYSWTRYANGNGNAGSAFVNTFNYNGTGQTDILALPRFSYSGLDSIHLSFDVAASSIRAPGLSMDTLEVMVTTDCGNSFTSVYKKWGSDLSTFSSPLPIEFFPLLPSQWRKENIDLSDFADVGNMLVLFKMTNNKENNVFVDNINITTASLPGLLKLKGLMVYPNHFTTGFTIWHYRQPTNLAYINIYNMLGQVVWSKLYTGNADRLMNIDLGNKPKGMYVLKLGYSDKPEVVEKLIKY